MPSISAKIEHVSSGVDVPKPYAEWALKYWLIFAAGAGGLAWLAKVLLKQTRDEKKDKDVLKALPEDWQGQFIAGPMFERH